MMPRPVVFLFFVAGCTAEPAPPIEDAGTPRDGMALIADLGRFCHTPCDPVDNSCPAAIYGVCVAGCCVCHPPDGGLCPVVAQPRATAVDLGAAASSPLR